MPTRRISQAAFIKFVRRELRLAHESILAGGDLWVRGLPDFSDDFGTIRFSSLEQYNRKNALLRRFLNGSVRADEIQAGQVEFPFGKGQLKLYRYKSRSGAGHSNAPRLISIKVDQMLRGSKVSPGRLVLVTGSELSS